MHVECQKIEAKSCLRRWRIKFSMNSFRKLVRGISMKNHVLQR
jgi:hypothetical protein